MGVMNQGLSWAGILTDLWGLMVRLITPLILCALSSRVLKIVSLFMKFVQSWPRSLQTSVQKLTVSLYPQAADTPALWGSSGKMMAIHLCRNIFPVICIWNLARQEQIPSSHNPFSLSHICLNIQIHCLESHDFTIWV